MPSLFQIVIVIVIIFVIFILVKMRYVKHKLGWLIMLGIILVLYIGFLASTGGKDINYNSWDGTQTAIKLYLSWMSHNIDNLKTITANTIKLDWNPNVTVSDK